MKPQNSKEFFKESFKIEKDEKKETLLRLQTLLEEGIILEEDLNKNEKKRLEDLYDSQINEMKEKILESKKEIRQMLNKINKPDTKQGK